MYPSNWQQYQPKPSLVGRIINSPDDTTPNDVPMDGTLGVFPLADGSAVYTKRWMPDGTISTIEYRPTEIPAITYSPAEQKLLERIEAIEVKIGGTDESA